MEQVDGGLDEPTELEPEQGSLKLSSAEDTWTRADWEKAAAGVLRKARRLSDDDPDELVWGKLARRTLDDIDVAPLGTPDLLDEIDVEERPTRSGPWDIRSHITVGDPKLTNEEILVDLNGGVTSVWLTGSTDLATVLADVLLDLAPVVGDGSTASARALLGQVEGRDLHPGTNLGVDPAALSGDELLEFARAAERNDVLAFVIDATRIHDRGASDAQELGWSMAAAVAYLRSAEAAGIALSDAVRLVEFRYAATDEQFPTIAKLRAARRLWTRVQALCDLEPEAQRQHGVTSRPMMSRFDPYVNMLRTTVAAFAAGVGGADSVTVLPFDAPLGRPETLGRRVARNISHLLIDESHLAKVADPAGGSYAVEKLTDDLAVAGWDVFGRLEEGADLDALVAATVERRNVEVARRKRPITGLTEFPNLAEVLPERTPDGAFDGVLPYGAQFEAMRDDPASASVFLATLGPVAQHTARATFASNLFAAGGIAVDVAGATEGPDDLVAAYSGQRVVCLTGPDAAYAAWGAAAIERLREAGAHHVIIAGKAIDGVDDSCAMGVDALAFLTRTREQLR